MRSFGFDLITTGQFMGSLLLVGGTAGVFAGGWLADRLGAADKRWYARLPAIAWLITAPTFAAGLLVPMPAASWVLLLIPNALNILWRSEEHTSELQSLMRISYAVFCLKKKKKQ